MNPYAIAVLVIGLLSGAAGFKLGMDHEQAKQLEKIEAKERERKEAQDLADQRAIGYEQIVTYLNGKVRQSQKEWRDVLQAPVYRDCKPDAVGLRLLNEFIGSANRSRKPLVALSDGGPASDSGGHGGSDGKPAQYGE